VQEKGCCVKEKEIHDPIPVGGDVFPSRETFPSLLHIFKYPPANREYKAQGTYQRRPIQG